MNEYNNRGHFEIQISHCFCSKRLFCFYCQVFPCLSEVAVAATEPESFGGPEHGAGAGGGRVAGAGCDGVTQAPGNVGSLY